MRGRQAIDFGTAPSFCFLRLFCDDLVMGAGPVGLVVFRFKSILESQEVEP